MKKYLVLSILIIFIVFLFVLTKTVKPSQNDLQISNMKLTSSAYSDNQKIPEKYTCKGEGISPPLEISEIPTGTQSLVLILKDPDAPTNTFIHWVIWNISPKVSTIPENTVPEGATVGVNNIEKNFYFSPCPHQGQHHYVFYLYALDTTLTLPPEANANNLEQIISGHILGATTLTGIFP